MDKEKAEILDTESSTQWLEQLEGIDLDIIVRKTSAGVNTSVKNSFAESIKKINADLGTKTPEAEEQLSDVENTEFILKSDRKNHFAETYNKLCFTWQPHGSQFTIQTEVPEEAIKFQIQQPPTLSRESVLESISFDESWITIL